jgi:hypothetical protein
VAEKPTELCVGCGAAVEKIDGPFHRYMTSAPGCWARYGELLSVFAIDPGATATRVLCVDAYAAQHPGTPGPQAIQSVAVHLLNMYGYLVLARPVAIPQTLGLNEQKGAFRWLEPPPFTASRTVFDVPFDAPLEEIAVAARDWAESVWDAWSPHHAQIVEWYSKFTSPGISTHSRLRRGISEF